MIAKRILSPKGGSGFERLARYVVNARNGVDPASWERLGAYILDENGQGEKVAWSRVTNCENTDPGWATKEILATQARNTRSRADKSYHLVVSFPEGEKPSREQLADIEDRLCEAIGFGEHQRISAVHQNTDNWHLHVAINSVHPRTFRNVAPFQDHFRLQQACVELEIKHGLTREPHTTEPEQGRGRDKARGRAADFEAQHGGQSFGQWVREHAAAALLAARDSGQGWQGLHRAAAVYDLEIKPRGAGLVIGHRGDKRLDVKASDVDRALSMQALTAALGPYEPPGRVAEAEQAQSRYAKPERQGSLYEAFQREREAALRARDAAMRELRVRHLTYARELAAWHRERVRHERLTGLRGHLRRDSFQHLAEQRKRDHAERVAREAEERRQTRARHPIPTWQGFLEAEAARGNETALKSLRNRQQRAERIENDLLTAEDAEDARHVVHQHLRPAIRRDGRVVYRVTDGGLVVDTAREIQVTQSTAAATFLALELAADRFGSRPLVVKGTEAFRLQVAELAGAKALGVQFADPALERQRSRGREQRIPGRDHDHGRG